MVRKRDVEGAVPYAKLYVCRGDHRSPNEKQIIDKRELRKEPPHRRLSRQLPSMGAIRKPLLEERCHEVTEWWQIERQGKATPQSTELPAPLKVRVIGRPMVTPTEMRGALGYGTKKERRGCRSVRKTLCM